MRGNERVREKERERERARAQADKSMCVRLKESCMYLERELHILRGGSFPKCKM